MAKSVERFPLHLDVDNARTQTRSNLVQYLAVHIVLFSDCIA